MTKDNHKDKENHLKDQTSATDSDNQDIALRNATSNLQLDIHEFGLIIPSNIYDDSDIYNISNRASKMLLETQYHNQQHRIDKACGIHSEPCYTCYQQWEIDKWRREEERVEYMKLPWIQRFINWCRKNDPSACNEDDYDW